MRLPWPPFFPPSAPGRPRSTLQKLVPSANRSCPAKGQGDAATSRTTNTNEGNSSRSAIPLSRPSGAAFAQSCSLLASGLGRGCLSVLDLGQRKKKNHSDPGGTRNRIFPTIFPPHNSNIPDGGEGRGVAGESRRLGCGVESCWEAVDKRRDAERQGAGREASVPIGRQRAESGSTVVAEKALAAFPAGEAFP